MRESRRRGSTLVECVTAILVLGIAIPPIVGLFREVAANDVDRTLRAVGLMYADSLMEEIASKAFEDPDEASGSFGTEEGQRAAYDDIDDYDDLSNSPPRRLDGTPLDDYGGFSRRAQVDNVTSSTPDPGPSASSVADGSTKLKRIIVTVAWPGGDVTLKTLRALSVESSSAIDEAASAAGVGTKGKKSFELPIVSITPNDLIVEAFSLSAIPDTEPLHRVRLDNRTIYHEHPTVPLPTGIISVADAWVEDRTIDAFEQPPLRVELDGNVNEPVTFTLVLYFSDGSSATITFTVGW